MKLPTDEEDDEQMMRVPETFEMGTAAFLDREEHHGSERCGHDPACRPGASDELREEERRNALPGRLRIRVRDRELRVINHVCGNVHKSEEDHGPGDRLMKRDVLVEGNNVVEGRATKK